MRRGSDTAVTRRRENAGVERPADGATTVIVTVWRHGPGVLGRVKTMSAAETGAELGRPYRSVEEICAAVRAVVESVASGP
jgi:hypothetical protein